MKATEPALAERSKPVLLFNDECGVCRRIARWVEKSAKSASGEVSIIERPIGDDPEALRLLNPELDIWEAYATIHLLMPDGSMKRGGEAVAEVLRRLSNTRWLARSFSVSVFGVRPFQSVLDVAYAVLADTRPLFGCESCGTPSPWLKPIRWIFRSVKALIGKGGHHHPSPHFTSRSAAEARPPRPAPATPGMSHAFGPDHNHRDSEENRKLT
jgi:predicted DCC family thiol-disulfide oxidoreductase YuxK